MNSQSKHSIFIPVMIFMAGFFFSCENNLEDVHRITMHPNNPDETSEDLHIIYTDSGYAQIEIFARISETYSKPEPVTKFKDGLKVNFYNDNGEIGSVLTSIYGEIDKRTGNITVRDSVKLENLETEKTLESEVLYWNKKGDSVFTDKAVVVRSPDFVLSGIGAWTTPAFDTAQFYHPTAEIFVKD